MKKILLTIIIILLLASCSVLQNKGYIIDDYDNFDKIKVGITHRDNVINILGTPSYRFDNNAYLYYSYKRNIYGINFNNTFDENIFLVIFDEEGFTKKVIHKFNKKSTFKMNDKTMNLNSTKNNFLKELFSDLNVIIAK